MPTGKPGWCALIAQGVRKSHCSHAIVMLYLRDIDATRRESLQAREQLTQALQQAERLSQARSSFVGRLSHELRTPLSAVLGFLALARKTGISAEQQALCLGKAEDAAQRMLSLVTDLLALAADGQQTALQDAFRLGEVQQRLDAAFSPRASAGQLTFSIQLEGTVESHLIGDAAQLEQILQRLLDNAFKFTEPGGHVSLRIAQLARQEARVFLRFTVSDDGAGFEEGFQERVFEAFEQEEPMTSRRHGGTGLGLALARGMVRTLGGTIEAQSQPGKGSVFTVTLPFGVGASVRAAASGSPSDAMDLHGYRVLLAEDNALSREMAVAMLHPLGLIVDTAQNGQEAFESVIHSPQGQLGLVLMDVQMPVMDGFDATRAIRASAHPDARTLPIIALSANAQPEDIAISLASGMNAHLAKPIDPDALSRVLWIHLSGRARAL